MARTIESTLLAWYANKANLAATKAKKALEDMSDEAFKVEVAEFEASQDAGTDDDLVTGEVITYAGRIVDITALTGDNEGSSAVSTITASGKPLTFVATNKQVGDSDRKGFGLRVGGFATFTVEERIAGKTQFRDPETGAVTYHKKDGYGFRRAEKLDSEAFLMEGIVKNANPAVQDALLKIHLKKLEVGLITT